MVNTIMVKLLVIERINSYREAGTCGYQVQSKPI